LLFDASFNITGNTGQQNTQTYFSDNSNGGCFSRTPAAAGVLTSITDGGLPAVGMTLAGQGDAIIHALQKMTVNALAVSSDLGCARRVP